MGLFLYERRDQTDAAVAAVATALAALYASLTYATSVQDVIATEIGLLVAGLVGAVGAMIAVHWRSQLVGALGILGALAAPVLVNSGTSTAALGFMVIALVATVAVLFVAALGLARDLRVLLTAPQLAFWAEDRDDLVLPLSMLVLFWPSSSSRRSATSSASRPRSSARRQRRCCSSMPPSPPLSAGS